MYNHPLLHVIIPLISALICAMSRNGRVAWMITSFACWVSFALVILIFITVTKSGPVFYNLGGWQPPLGIEYRIDIFNAFVMLVITFSAAIMMPYALSSVENEIEPKKQSLFYCVFLFCLTGLLGMASSKDIFNIYVFMEVAALSSYTLVAMGRSRKARLSAFEYLVLGTIGATFFLIGIGLIYAVTGTLNITDISARLGDVADQRPVKAAFAFITLGLAMKIAMFPMHTWLVNAYSYSPSLVSAFLSATSTKVGIYVFVRLAYMAFGYQFSFTEMPASVVLIVFSVAAIIGGTIAAIYQQDVRRLLAFSSVAQIGYIMLGIGIATGTGLAASITHMANHALAKGALFLVSGVVFYQIGGTRLEHFRGLGRKMPVTMAAFVISGLSLLGVPLTAGFVSKLYLLQALIEDELWLFTVIVLVTSLLSVVYIWKIIEVVYFRAPVDSGIQNSVPYSMQISIWIMVSINIVFGVYTGMTSEIALEAAQNLFRGYEGL